MSPRRPAVLVATGILLSRVFGLVRQRVFGHYFGASASADAFMAAVRIPNLLQNLFGEGVLSASFIPVYAKLLAEGREQDARRVAGAVAGLLGLVVGLLVIGGYLATPLLVDVIAPGFTGEQRLQTIRLVRILFPGMGLLVLSAWCLGILNSHGRFFLSYAAPVVWNVAIITALLVYGESNASYDLAAITAWGAVAGSALQFLVQLPAVLSLAGPIKITVRWATEHVRTVTRNFFPVFLGRGVVQISAYVDTFLGSMLPVGAVASLAYAQTLYLLPVSLFGMSVAAAELPAMSRLRDGDEAAVGEVGSRLGDGLARISFFVLPSAVAFIAFGDIIAGAVWAILGGAAIGLLASTQSRLYASAYYALQDTRTPMRFAMVRVAVSISLGWMLALRLPGMLDLEPRWGVVGITLAASAAAWIEWYLLRRRLPEGLRHRDPPVRHIAAILLGAVLAAFLGTVARQTVGTLHPIPLAVIVLGAYGIAYLALTWLFRVPQARALTKRRG